MTSSKSNSPDPARVLVIHGGARSGGLGQRLADFTVECLEKTGAQCRRHDLLADGFDPVLRLGSAEPHATRVEAAEEPLVARYQADAIWAHGFGVLHPVYWFAPPALVKGWVDRVFVHDVALRQKPEGSPEPLFGGKRALVVQTFNASRTVDLALFRGLAGSFWKRAVFASVGIGDVTRLALHELPQLDTERLARFEDRLAEALAKLARKQ
jgi:putative NADPH-quinone reductase